ncbi:MAG: N-acetylglucosamine-6-phosphate deacetylase [Propionicimonas sp.]
MAAQPTIPSGPDRPLTIVHGGTLVTGGEGRPDAWVAFGPDRIVAVGDGDGWRPLATAEATVVAARGRFITPGFVDLHGHGAGGHAYQDGPDAARAALEVHRSHGTTRSVLSLVTAELDDLSAQLAQLAQLTRADPLVLGTHAEGPFLAESHRGAHDPGLLRDPTAVDVAQVIAAANGTLVQVTLAPELPGAFDAITTFRAAGVRVAIGHTGADGVLAARAFAAGASLLSHAFNGMRGIHHRSPGPVLAAAANPDVTLEVINDGIHVAPEVVALLFRLAPGRVALITDSMAATGCGDGEYRLGSQRVIVHDHVARLTDGALAGSTLTMDEAVRRAVRNVGLPVPIAVAAATEVPARAIGRADLGRLEPGGAADVLVLGPDLHVERVWAGGLEQPAYEPGT